MNRTSAVDIHTRVRLGFVTALVSLVMIGFISQRRLQQSIEDAVWVRHTEEVLDQIEGIGSAMRTAESEERGFLLTGDQKLRENFRDAQQQTSAKLAVLRTLTTDNPHQQRRLERFESLSKQVLRGEASAITRRQRSSAAGRPYTVASIGDEQAVQQIRSLSQEIKDEETRLLRERSRNSSNSSAVVRAVVAAVSFLGATSVILWSLFVGRYLRRREQSETTLLEVQQGLEARARERASELARLAASLQSEITERRKTEEQLRESEQRYRLVAKAANGAIWDWDLVNDHVHWNEDAQILFGYSPEEIDESWWRERVHPEDRDRVAAGIRAVVRSAKEHWSDEYRYRRAEGSYAEVLDRGYVVRDPEGKPVRMIGSMLDLSVHRRAERALQESEQRYRMLFDDSPLPMVVFDAETLAYLAVNAAAEELYGYTREEFLKLNLRDTRPPEQIPGLLDFLKSVEAADAYRNTFTSRRKDGQLLMIDARTRTIQFGGRRVRLALIIDITEQKHLESQLQQAQKMEAVGRLAGGIAHDFNNLLTVILGYSDGILRKLDEKDPLRSKVSEIQTAGQRAANLTSQLLAFSRKQILQPQTLELNTVISNISQMLRRLLGEDIQIVLHLEGALGQIQADPTQLEQVLVNMAVNARDAMPQGGQLVIETHNIEVSREFAFAPGIPPGDYVVLVVTDTGCGMDEAIKARVFEPFFTTKEVGKGTGLGLSMVLGVVQQSGGTVTVYSEVGVGTTFRIYLPRWYTPAAQPQRASESKVLPAGKGATILLVEDENRVRALAREVLSDAGYAVSAATNGKEALKIAESSVDAPDLVLTDVVMPEMSGPELADHLRKKWPRLPIVFTSGYTDHALLMRSALQRDTPFLQKPYTPESLLEQVAAVLKRTSRAIVLVSEDEKHLAVTSKVGIRR